MAINVPLRLQKYIAQCGLASRRRAEEMIREGRVAVDGKTITDMGFCITSDTQSVTLDGKAACIQDRVVTLLLNKPKGYVTTLSDPQGRPIVTSLLHNIAARVFPVGRLDLDTEGALILTSDGELAESIQHPRYEVKKTYEAVVSGRPTRKALQQLERGLIIEGKKTYPASIGDIKDLNHAARITITIHEGRKRQVKKMFAAIGNPVLSLKRTAYGQLFLGDLPLGAYRILTTNDVKKIFL